MNIKLIRICSAIVISVMAPVYAHAACSLSTPSTTISTDCGPLVVDSGQTSLNINAQITGNPGVDQLSIVTNFNVNASGIIQGTSTGLRNEYEITTLTNAGSIKATNSNGFAIMNHGPGRVYGSIGTLNNTGTIQGGSANGGVAIANTNSNDFIGTINNYGTITGHVSIDNIGTITTITNTSSGAITGSIQNTGTINTLNNSGVISGGTYGVLVTDGTGGRTGTITTLTNSGLISGTSDGIRISGGSEITTLTNTAATYSAGVSGISSIRIADTATIYNLNNAQNNLTYNGNLPWNYNVIVSGTEYGKLAVTNGSGTTNFGIYPGSSFTIGNNVTYGGVLSGVTMATIGGVTSGTYGGGLFRTNWTLAANASNPNQLDLTATTAAVTPNVPGQSGGALANAIQSSSTAAASTTLANGTTLAGAAQSLTQQQASQLSSVHAEGYSSNMTIGLEQMAHITNTVMDRIHNPLSARGGTSTAYEMDQGKYVWADAAAVKGTVNSYAGLDGFGYNLYDMIIGSDIYRTASGGIGVYGGAGYTTMTEPAQVTQNFNTTNYYAGLYGGKYLPYNFKLSGALGYMYGNTNASRNNPNVGLFTGGAANSNYNTNGAYGAFKFSRPFQATQNLTLTPYIGASYSQLWMGQARESGGNDFNYTISNATAYTTVTFIGGEFIMPLTGAVKNPLSAVGFYRFGYDWFANSGYAHSVTANSPIFGSFNQVGADMGPALNLMGLGLQGYITQKVSARAGVVGSANTNGWQVGVGGELKWEL